MPDRRATALVLRDAMRAYLEAEKRLAEADDDEAEDASDHFLRAVTIFRRAWGVSERERQERQMRDRLRREIESG